MAGVAAGVVVVVCGGATFVVEVDVGTGDSVDVVDEVVVGGGRSVLVVAGAEVTADDVLVWA